MISMTKFGVSFCFIFCFGTVLTVQENVLHPDTGLLIDAFLEKYNYPFESHTVQTEDDYVLTMHRIPNKEGAPVLLMHGLLGGSIDWLNNGPNKSLGLILADQGFDVWLGNQRGNTYSRKHTTLDPVSNKTEFWDFSFHEIGIHDLSAKIDHILNVTGQAKLHYVGFSQGTTAFFALTASKPEYNVKIQSMTALAPVAIMSNMTSPIVKILSQYFNLITLGLDVLGIEEILPRTELLLDVAEVACHDGSEIQELCALVFYLFSGYTPLELNKTMITVYVTNTPAGSSKKQAIHYLQENMSGFFRQYDYGLLGNLAKYGQVSPPEYDVSKITAPISLFYGDNDALSATINVEEFANKLPNVKARSLITGFGHLDTIWGIDAPDRIYKDVVNIIKNS